MSSPKTILAKFLLSIAGLFLINNLKAQSYEFLKHKWLHAKSDTARVNAGLELNNKYYYQHDDSIYAQNNLLLKIYLLARQINYTKGIIEVSFRLGQNYNFQSNVSKAIEYYYLSLKKSESNKNLDYVARAKMGIGLVYFTQNNWSKAIDFFKGSLIISKQIQDKRRIATQQYLIGASLIALKKTEDSKLFIDSALKINFENKDLEGVNQCRLVLADIFKEQKQFDSAIKYYNALLPIFTSQKEYLPISFINSSFAQIRFSFGNYQEAQLYAQKAYNYSLLVPYPLPKLKATEILYNINKSLGNYKRAYYYYHEYNNIKDSIENNDFASQISVAQATYEFEKEQATIKAEQDKKDLQYNLEIQDKNLRQNILEVIVIISIIVVIIIIFAYRWVSKQKKISEDLLLNILPKETVMELKKFGKSIPKNHTEVTIMFCDIKNFSHIAESLSPEAVVKMLDTYFQQFDIISEKYGVEKIKTIGDAYMCVGGLNTNPNIAAYDTLQAALEFIKFNESIEKEMLKTYNQAFYFRIGIHTGNVVSGVVGLKKYSYDIWGDAVNIAARMEQNSTPGMINISGGTYELIKHKNLKLNYRGKIPIKNKGEIDMYFVEEN